MIERIIFRSAAESELKEAYQWYEERVHGLGLEFIRAVEGCIEIIRRNPDIHPVAYKDITPNRVVVISVFHSSRDPNGTKISPL